IEVIQSDVRGLREDVSTLKEQSSKRKAFVDNQFSIVGKLSADDTRKFQTIITDLDRLSVQLNNLQTWRDETELESKRIQRHGEWLQNIEAMVKGISGETSDLYDHVYNLEKEQAASRGVVAAVRDDTRERLDRLEKTDTPDHGATGRHRDGEFVGIKKHECESCHDTGSCRSIQFADGVPGKETRIPCPDCTPKPKSDCDLCDGSGKITLENQAPGGPPTIDVDCPECNPIEPKCKHCGDKKYVVAGSLYNKDIPAVAISCSHCTPKPDDTDHLLKSEANEKWLRESIAQAEPVARETEETKCSECGGSGEMICTTLSGDEHKLPCCKCFPHNYKAMTLSPNLQKEAQAYEDKVAKSGTVSDTHCALTRWCPMCHLTVRTKQIDDVLYCENCGWKVGVTDD
ncbi:MAG: hypothetical protein ACYTEX_22410, partial [Planctomycetota bacterium]